MEKEFFMGSVDHQLDDKNRLRIPSKYKKLLVGEDGKKTYSFMRGKTGCIFVMDDETLQEKLRYAAIGSINEASPETRALFGWIFPAEEDAQGRVTLPTPLKMVAGITKDIVTVGHGDRLEIWDKERYYNYISNVEFDDIFGILRI